MSNKVLMYTKSISLSSQDVFCNYMYWDDEIDRLILRSITIKELTNTDDISSLLLSDDTIRLDKHTGSDSKIKLEILTDVIMNYGSSSNQIVILK